MNPDWVNCSKIKKILGLHLWFQAQFLKPWYFLSDGSVFYYPQQVPLNHAWVYAKEVALGNPSHTHSIRIGAGHKKEPCDQRALKWSSIITVNNLINLAWVMERHKNPSIVGCWNLLDWWKHPPLASIRSRLDIENLKIPRWFSYAAKAENHCPRQPVYIWTCLSLQVRASFLFQILS